MSLIRDKIIATITQKSERDKQSKIGPSSLGETCELCLAREMHGEAVERTFSLAAWIGTAIHEKMDRDEQDPTITTERRVDVGEIEDYGRLKGTSDRYDADDKAVVDLKSSTKKKIAAYKKGYYEHNDGRVEFFDDTLLKYYVQLNTYGKGMEDDGYEVEKVALAFIPRDSNSVHDIWVVEFPYNRQIAEAALERAAAIYAHGPEGLEHAPECFNYGRD